jgi:hypothetical protein
MAAGSDKYYANTRSKLLRHEAQIEREARKMADYKTAMLIAVARANLAKIRSAQVIEKVAELQKQLADLASQLVATR